MTTNKTLQTVIFQLSHLIDADSQTQQRISSYIQQYGIQQFFVKLDTLVLCPEVKIKLEAVKTILDTQKDGDTNG
jgi:hypothetical protein